MSPSKSIILVYKYDTTLNKNTNGMKTKLIYNHI